MDGRQERLLQLIIDNYIDTAEPIGSRFLVSHYDLDVGDATVRNEMRDLEEAGYLTHPHTSAGRIPTDVGYRYYVDHLMRPAPVSKKIKSEMGRFGHKSTENTAHLKHLGRYVAETMSSAVLVAFGTGDIYYTGISYLFSQPEFRDNEQAIGASAMFDRSEETMNDVRLRFDDSELTVFIGNENPLGAVCSLIGTRLQDGSLFTIVGPTRMEYEKAVGILEYLRTIF